MIMINQFIKTTIMNAPKFRVLGLLALLFVVTACVDDFSEKDLLELQAELAEIKAQNDFDRELLLLAQELANDMAMAQANDEIQRAYMEFLNSLDSAQDEALRQRAIDLLTQAGLITDYTVNMTANDALVAGGFVTLSNGTGSVADTTNAEGAVTFTNVPVGLSTVTVSATDHLGFSYVVDFGRAENNLETVFLDGQSVTVVEPNSSVSTVRMINTGVGSQVATVKGKVTGQTDLTNTTSENLAGIPVLATLANNLGFAGESSLITFTSATNVGSVSDIYFDENTGFGKDTTGADGSYSMKLPADRDLSLYYYLTFPETISANQRLAAVVNDSATVVDIPTIWGVNQTSTAAPNVFGYQFSVSSQGAMGSGFAIGSIAAVGRSLTAQATAAEWDAFINGGGSTLGERDDIGNNLTDIGTINNYGQTNNFNATPSVTVDGNSVGDADAKIDAELTWDLGSVSITASSGGAYTAAATADLYIYVIGTFDDQTDVDTIRYNVSTETADGAGDFAANTVDLSTLLGVQAQYSDDAGGWTNSGFFDNLGATTIEATHDFSVESFASEGILTAGSSTGGLGTESTISNTGADGDNLTWNVEAGGVGYASAPTFTFSGFTTAPNWIINEFPLQYQFNIASPGTGYTFVPDVIELEARDYSTDVNTTHITQFESVSGYQSDSSLLITYDFEEHLTIESGGFTTQNDSVAYFVTVGYWHGAPSLVAMEAGEAVTIDNVSVDGTLVNFRVAESGSGYIAAPNISFGARSLMANPGSLDLSPEAAADFSAGLGTYDINERTKQVIWSIGDFTTITITEGGLGYTVNINDTGTGNISDADAQVDLGYLEPGELIISNLDYGYGTRESELEGDDNDDIVYYN